MSDSSSQELYRVLFNKNLTMRKQKKTEIRIIEIIIIKERIKKMANKKNLTENKSFKHEKKKWKK